MIHVGSISVVVWIMLMHKHLLVCCMVGCLVNI